MSSRPSVSLAFKTLDAWRAIAALMVVTYHTGLPAVMGIYPDLSRIWLFKNIRIGAYGVQIFFVISGYCIAQAALNSIERKHGARAFALARLHRYLYLCLSRWCSFDWQRDRL
jgi:peptidoglycan/LPS O-acetylase OafA/YrhL